MDPLRTNIRAEFEPAPVGQRRGVRAAAAAGAEADRGGLDRTSCRITDLSRDGARISSYSALKKDSMIWLTLPGIGQVIAAVRWADDFEAGCQFAHPLADEQVDMLNDVGRT